MVVQVLVVVGADELDLGGVDRATVKQLMQVGGGTMSMDSRGSVDGGRVQVY